MCCMSVAAARWPDTEGVASWPTGGSVCGPQPSPLDITSSISDSNRGVSDVNRPAQPAEFSRPEIRAVGGRRSRHPPVSPPVSPSEPTVSDLGAILQGLAVAEHAHTTRTPSWVSDWSSLPRRTRGRSSAAVDPNIPRSGGHQVVTRTFGAVVDRSRRPRAPARQLWVRSGQSSSAPPSPKFEEPLWRCLTLVDSTLSRCSRKIVQAARAERSLRQSFRSLYSTCCGQVCQPGSGCSHVLARMSHRAKLAEYSAGPTGRA